MAMQVLPFRLPKMKAISPFAGIRLLPVSGELWRCVTVQDSWDDFWRNVFTQLPKDATLVPMPDTPIRHAINSFSAATDLYLVAVASHQWKPLKEGEVIPVLNITVDRTKVTTMWSNKWYWRWYARMAEFFVRLFPRWVKY